MSHEMTYEIQGLAQNREGRRERVRQRLSLVLLQFSDYPKQPKPSSVNHPCSFVHQHQLQF